MKNMMKILLTLIISFISMLAVAVPSAYVEGEHYKANLQRIAVSNEQVEVVELFMYTCPHCYHLESDVTDWKKTLGEKVKFVQVPAVFSPKQVPLASAFYAAEALGLSGKLHPLFFEAIHEDGMQLTSKNQILDYVASQGVDRASFEKMMKSFAVKTKVKKATAITKMSGISGVPAFVVDGQYNTSGPMAGSIEALFDVVDFLINQSSH